MSSRKKNRMVRAANSIKRKISGYKDRANFQRCKGAAVLLQRWYRCHYQLKAYKDIKTKATTLQAFLRGNNARRPQRMKILYHNYTAKLELLSVAEDKVALLEKTCPITMAPIKSPIVCVADGHTYERGAITTWVKRNGSSPLTREPVTMQDLIVEGALVEKLKNTRASLEKTTRQSIIYKLEKDNLQQSHAMTKMKLTLSANEVKELKTLLEKEASALLKVKAENLSMKQELAGISAKTDAIESDNAELRKRLNSASSRARSVQYERDEFQVQMASLTAKAVTLNAEVEQNNELHERLLGELRVAQTVRTKGNAALLLQMAVAQKNSRSLLEETVWDPGVGVEEVEASHPLLPYPPANNRSRLEEGTWDDDESDSDDESVHDDDENSDYDDVGKLKIKVVEGSRSSMEDECWTRCKATGENVTAKIAINAKKDEPKGTEFNIDTLRALIRTNKLAELGLDQRTAEFLLSDEDFMIFMGTSKKDFSRLPKWRKMQKKRDLELF